MNDTIKSFLMRANNFFTRTNDLRRIQVYAKYNSVVNNLENKIKSHNNLQKDLDFLKLCIMYFTPFDPYVGVYTKEFKEIIKQLEEENDKIWLF